MKRHPLIPALLAGVAIGFGAYLLKWLIAAISRLCTAGFHAHGPNWLLLVLPVAGIVVTGLLARKLFRVPLEHATDRLRRDVATGANRLSPKLTVAPIVTSAVTLGCGGSAGSEGPIAYAGAAIANNLARLCRMSPRMLTVMMVCGAGAGIAAIFKAPVGGMLFAIEVLGLEMSVPSLMLLVAMCLSASLTASALSGFTPDMTVTALQPPAMSLLLPAVALGVFCGIYSVYYLTTGLGVARRLRAIGRPLVRNVVSGIILGIGLFCFPALYGEGYALMGHMMSGRPVDLLNGIPLMMGTDMLWALAGILITKGIVTYATNSGGGVAGEFAPTLFAGSMAGYAFALASNAWLGTSFHPATFALMGMAGVMAGAIRAPFMTIFITVEMTSIPTLLLPVSVTAATACLTSRALLSLFKIKS